MIIRETSKPASTRRVTFANSLVNISKFRLVERTKSLERSATTASPASPKMVNVRVSESAKISLNPNARISLRVPRISIVSMFGCSDDSMSRVRHGVFVIAKASARAECSCRAYFSMETSED